MEASPEQMPVLSRTSPDTLPFFTQSRTRVHNRDTRYPACHFSRRHIFLYLYPPMQSETGVSMTHHERGLSECVAQILIAFLVILVALIIIGAMTGVIPGLLQKSAFVVVTATPYQTGDGTHVILLYHKQGDRVNLNGTSQTDGVSEIAIMLTPSSGSPVLVRPGTTIKSTAWGPGQYLVIYETTPSGTYLYSDLPTVGMEIHDNDDYTVQIIDTKVNVLLHTLPVKIP